MAILMVDDNGATITQLTAAVNKFFQIQRTDEERPAACYKLYRLWQLMIESRLFILSLES